MHLLVRENNVILLIREESPVQSSSGLDLKWKSVCMHVNL